MKTIRQTPFADATTAKQVSVASCAGNYGVWHLHT
jgi:hypothetical protein